MNPLLSVAILTYRRDDALKNTLARLDLILDKAIPTEVILVDNNADGVDRRHLLDSFASASYIASPENLGVTGGRNLAIDAASGDVIVFLDDDALLEGGTDFASKLLNAFSANSNLAAIAFKSVIGIERCDDPIEFPHTNKSLDRHSSFETFRFIGVGHAVRAKCLREVGRYCERFFYGMEEFDLALRLMKRGYTIEYRPEFRVQHMKSGDGRLPSKAVIQRMYTNKLAVGWMHLPMRYFLASASAWFVKTTIDSRSLVVPARAILNFIRNAVAREYLVRDPSETVAERIRQLGGKAWR